MKFFLIVLLSLLTYSDAFGWSGIVEQVQSGTTLLVRPIGGNPAKVVRLYGVDTPTLRQPYGLQAKEYLEKLTPIGNKVNIDSTLTDSNGIEVALLQVESVSVNYKMLEAGWAWVKREECQGLFCRRWYIQERYAIRDRRGVWNSKYKTPPWQWGRQSINMKSSENN